jgi:uncharacterized protein (TIGR02996 family)
MSEEIAFLAEILENPCDDACRLIYADWLEESGDRRASFLLDVFGRPGRSPVSASGPAR